MIKLDFLTFQDFYLCRGMFAEKISTGVKHHIHEQTAKKSTLTPNLTDVVIGLHIQKIFSIFISLIKVKCLFLNFLKNTENSDSEFNQDP